MSAMPETTDPSTEAAGFAGARAALERYTDPLLRRCAARFARQRLQDDAADLRERILEGLENPVTIDRALKTLTPDARRVLRLASIGRQTRWRVQSIVEADARWSGAGSVAPILELLEAGFAFPELPARGAKLASWETWLGGAKEQPLFVHVAPLAANRAQREPLPLPKVDFDVLPAVPTETDGLEWLLRVCVAWQFVREAPLRLTQQGGFFKRDLDRLRAHPILSAPPADQVGEVPDAALLAIGLAQAQGFLVREADQVRALDSLPGEIQDLGVELAGQWSALIGIADWDPRTGWSLELPTPLGVSAVLALAVLDDLPADQWAVADDIDAALTGGPDGKPGAISSLLLGVLHQLRLVQAVRHNDRWWVRLSQAGKAIVAGQEPKLPLPPIEQTLVVQPNLEIIVYRQGLTPALVVRLTRIAEWKALGLACTLALTPESVYRGLESGETMAELLALLERHSARALSDTVLDSLRSWASKRERVLVYPSAFLLEFRTTADLDMAVRRGLVELRITDRIGLIGAESRIDYSQFRLTGTRDYLAADEICVEASADGLAVYVNEHKSDLLLESELRRFAEPAESTGERPEYRATIQSLRTARNSGLNVAALDAWYQRRAGQGIPASVLLLLTADESPAFHLGTRMLVRVPSEELADGLAAWPESARLLGERLAPALFDVPAENAEALRSLLDRLGVRWDSPN